MLHSVTHSVTCHSAVSIRPFRKACSASQNDSAGHHRGAGGRRFAFCFRKAFDSVEDHYAPRARLIATSFHPINTARSVLSIRGARSASSEIPLSVSLGTREGNSIFRHRALISYHSRRVVTSVPTFVHRCYLMHASVHPRGEGESNLAI